jgi:hypothetical protein
MYGHERSNEKELEAVEMPYDYDTAAVRYLFELR